MKHRNTYAVYLIEGCPCDIMWVAAKRVWIDGDGVLIHFVDSENDQYTIDDIVAILPIALVQTIALEGKLPIRYLHTRLRYVVIAGEAAIFEKKSLTDFRFGKEFFHYNTDTESWKNVVTR